MTDRANHFSPIPTVGMKKMNILCFSNRYKDMMFSKFEFPEMRIILYFIKFLVYSNWVVILDINT